MEYCRLPDLTAQQEMNYTSSKPQKSQRRAKKKSKRSLRKRSQLVQQPQEQSVFKELQQHRPKAANTLQLNRKYPSISERLHSLTGEPPATDRAGQHSETGVPHKQTPRTSYKELQVRRGGSGVRAALSPSSPGEVPRASRLLRPPVGAAVCGGGLRGGGLRGAALRSFGSYVTALAEPSWQPRTSGSAWCAPRTTSLV